MASVSINPIKYLNSLPEFHGDNRELYTFINLIDRVHPFLQTFDAASQLLFSDVIKSKLKSKAREIIEINYQATAWTDIKGILINNFGDRRSCDELYDELRATIFKTNTLEFFNEIKSKLRRLNNKTLMVIGENPGANECAANNRRTALNIFKSKIPEPMKTILVCRNPTTLESAMDILFQAGYAYLNSNGTQTLRSNRPNNQQRLPNNQQQPNVRQNQPNRNNQPNYTQQNIPNNTYTQQNNGNTSNNQQQYRNPFKTYPQNHYTQQQQPKNQGNYNQSNNFRPQPQDNNYQPKRPRFENNQQQEPMDINNYEMTDNLQPQQPTDTNFYESTENFRLPASEETYHF